MNALRASVELNMPKLQGGYDVISEDLLRRFGRGWKTFMAIYRALAEACAVYDNSVWNLDCWSRAREVEAGRKTAQVQ